MEPNQKKFRIKSKDIEQLIPPMGGCLASDHIVVDGKEVGYMMQEEPSNSLSSGWIFMSGDETQEYADDAANWSIYEVNTICNYDRAIISYLDSKSGTAFGRDLGAEGFQEEPVYPLGG